MGGGSYSYAEASSRAKSYTKCSLEDAHYLDEAVFTVHSWDTSIKNDLNIKARVDKSNPEMGLQSVIRESRDSEEHPTSFPIIIGLDVTGSMGYIPKELIKNGFPKMMEKIMKEGVEHAQVCFMGIGDLDVDAAPIQMGQFETSDELCEKWLKGLYLEGGGGSNPYESYSLAWYAAARHTSTDSFDKRGIKGVCITIGDEPNMPILSKRMLNEHLGSAQADIDSAQLLEEAREKWNVYHINIVDHAGCRKTTQDSWGQLLGEDFVNTQSPRGEDVPDIIAGLVVRAYKEGLANAKTVLTETATPDEAVTNPKSKTADELLAEIKDALS